LNAEQMLRSSRDHYDAMICKPNASTIDLAAKWQARAAREKVTSVQIDNCAARRNVRRGVRARSLACELSNGVQAS
jgi:hypothetical protein